MRHWINLFESWTRPTHLYHGTKQENVGEIERHGLLVDKDVSWREMGPAVYLTDSQETARSYGEIIYQIKLSDIDSLSLYPDDYELEDYFDGAFELDLIADVGYEEDEAPSNSGDCSWEDSLRIVGQCKYYGDIPANKLKRIS